MTKRYPGGYITKTPPTVSTTSAPGIWTMEQQAAYQKAGTWPFGGPFNYIEDVFSTYLYTGNDSTQTISNGVDLNGNGGLVWLKGRSGGTYGGAVNHFLINSATGISNYLMTDKDKAQNGYGYSPMISSFNSNGFTLTNQTAVASTNDGSTKYVSWTFRKQPKFFDVVTWTGNAVTGRQISHALGSVPGFIVVKRTDATRNWVCYHRSLGNGSMIILNSTAAVDNASALWNNTTPTSTYFTVNNDLDVNGSGATYVAYLFAHNAGGFGLTGTDNVISCGSVVADASGNLPEVNLGWEPQWLMLKRATGGTGDWIIVDNMRNFSRSRSNWLKPNLSDAETNFTSTYQWPTATGFAGSAAWSPNATYIYIAIRRGPMKTPTSGTSVFIPNAQNAVNPTSTVTTNFPVDMSISAQRTRTLDVNTWVNDRLRGSSTTSTNWLQTSTTNAELNTVGFGYDNNTGYVDNLWGNPTSGAGAGGQSIIYWNFRRAPGFMDEVCYSGTGSATTVSHNLGVAPEMMIVKSRSRTGEDWPVYHTGLGTTIGSRNLVYVNKNLAATTNADGPACFGNGTTVVAPTSSVFTVGTQTLTNALSDTYVAYLFASCPGVSKVGSYTGTGATLTISCGFAARFVMIKRTDSTGDWFVWDTARGMVAGTDPRLALNNTNAEANNNWVYTDASGFQIVTTDATVNASGGSYIFLAIS